MIRLALVARTVLLGSALLSLSALTLAACKQGLDDRCQVNSDCEDDLICVLDVGATPQSGGKCSTVAGSDMASRADFSAPADLSSND